MGAHGLEALTVRSASIADLMDRFLKSEATLEMEVAAAVREKGPVFKLADLPSIQQVMDNHSQSAPVNPQALARASSTLEDESFKLLQKQLQYDTEAFKVWVRRCKEVEHALFYHQLQHKAKVNENATKAMPSKVLPRSSTQRVVTQCGIERLRGPSWLPMPGSSTQLRPRGWSGNPVTNTWKTGSPLPGNIQRQTRNCTEGPRGPGPREAACRHKAA